MDRILQSRLFRKQDDYWIKNGVIIKHWIDHATSCAQFTICSSDQNEHLTIQQELFRLNKHLSDSNVILKLLLDTLDDLYVAGFDNQTEIEENIDHVHNQIQSLIGDLDVQNKRPLTIYVWGKAIRKKLQYKVNKNYNAAVLFGRKKGVDWTLDGRSIEVQNSVIRCKGFPELLVRAVKDIEIGNFTTIGINCVKGRHRSVTMALQLQLRFYPNAQIHFLEL